LQSVSVAHLTKINMSTIEEVLKEWQLRF